MEVENLSMEFRVLISVGRFSFTHRFLKNEALSWFFHENCLIFKDFEIIIIDRTLRFSKN